MTWRLQCSVARWPRDSKVQSLGAPQRLKYAVFEGPGGGYDYSWKGLKVINIAYDYKWEGLKLVKKTYDYRWEGWAFKNVTINFTRKFVLRHRSSSVNYKADFQKCQHVSAKRLLCVRLKSLQNTMQSLLIAVVCKKMDCVSNAYRTTHNAYRTFFHIDFPAIAYRAKHKAYRTRIELRIATLSMISCVSKSTYRNRVLRHAYRVSYRGNAKLLRYT